jgi:hypothetical protein
MAICEGPDASIACEGGTTSGTLEGSVLVDAGEPVRQLAQHGGYVYWLSASGKVSRLARADAGAETLFQPAAQDPKPEAFALDDQSLYWYAQSQVFALPLSGGVSRLVATSNDGITAVFADTLSADVYLRQEHGIGAVPKTGGTIRTVYGPTTPMGAVIALSAGNLYFLETEEHPVSPDAGSDWHPWSTTAIRRVPVTGGPPESKIWMRGGAALAIEGTDFYWSQTRSFDTAEIRHASPTGASAMVATSAPKWIDWLGLDGQYLYYSQVELRCKKSILRIPRSGGAVETLVYDATLSGGAVTVGAGKLLWVTGATGSIIRAIEL